MFKMIKAVDGVQNLGNTVFDGVQDFVGNQGLLDSESQDFLDSAADFVQQNTNNAINFGQEIFPQISETTQNGLKKIKFFLFLKN